MGKPKQKKRLTKVKTQKSRIFTFGTIMIKIICRNLATVAKEPGPTTLMSHTKVLTTVTPSNFGNSSKLPPRKFSTIGSGNITHHTITFNGNGINTVGVRFTHNTFSESETLKSLIPTAELMKYSLSLSEVQQITPLGFSSKEELLEMDEQKVLDILIAFLKKTAPPEMEVDEITEALEAVFEKTFPYNHMVLRCYLLLGMPYEKLGTLMWVARIKRGMRKGWIDLQKDADVIRNELKNL